MYAIGIDIGGTNTKVGVISSKGEVVGHTKFPTESHSDFSVYIDRLYNFTSSLVKELKVKPIGIGIGAPNVNPQNGWIENAANLGWKDANLKELVKKKFDLPVYIENDANVAAIGEKVFGGAKDVDNFIVITLGTGLGSGIYSQGKLVNSFNGLAGEAGHLLVEKNGRKCGCGGKGHLETYVSVKGIKQTVLEITNEEMTFADILQLYRDKDSAINEAVLRTADYLAMGLSQVQALMLPKLIILSGGVSNLGISFKEKVEQRLEDYSYPPFKGQSKIELTKISLEDGAVLGAGALFFFKEKN